MTTRILVRIPERFVEFVDAATLRFEGQFPGVRVTTVAEGVCLEGEEAQQAELRSDFLHVLYREKIYAETLSMRQALMKAVLG